MVRWFYTYKFVLLDYFDIVDCEEGLVFELRSTNGLRFNQTTSAECYDPAISGFRSCSHANTSLTCADVYRCECK